MNFRIEFELKLIRIEFERKLEFTEDFRITERFYAQRFCSENLLRDFRIEFERKSEFTERIQFQTTQKTEGFYMIFLNNLDCGH